MHAPVKLANTPISLFIADFVRKNWRGTKNAIYSVNKRKTEISVNQTDVTSKRVMISIPNSSTWFLQFARFFSRHLRYPMKPGTRNKDTIQFHLLPTHHVEKTPWETLRWFRQESQAVLFYSVTSSCFTYRVLRQHGQARVAHGKDSAKGR